jgi:hypothetical protein
MGGTHGEIRQADLSRRYSRAAARPGPFAAAAAVPRPRDAVAAAAAEAARVRAVKAAPGFSTLFEIDESEDYLTRFQEHYPEVAGRYAVLARLGMAMIAMPKSSGAPPAPTETETMPAGYTYFGQLVAHDISFAADATPSLANAALQADAGDSLRDRPLLLQTIYGDGPVGFPLGYVCPELGVGEARRERTHLRLGPIPRSDDSTAVALPGRDLPRMACPHLNDVFDPLEQAFHSPAMRRVRTLVGEVIGRVRALPAGADAAWDDQKQAIAELLLEQLTPSLAATDVLVADPRNDQHPISRSSRPCSTACTTASAISCDRRTRRRPGSRRRSATRRCSSRRAG